METFLDILKYILPSLIALATAYAVLSTLLKSELKKMEMQMQGTTRKDTLMLRLQAYERLSVFLERTHPNNLVTRVNDQGLSASDLQYLLIETVKTEFEHNLSQQLYVSYDAWGATRFVKDDTIKIINLIGAMMPPNAPSSELAKQIINYFGQVEGGAPAQKALNIINVEVKNLL